MFLSSKGFNDFESKLKILRDDEVEQSTSELQRKIDQMNSKLDNSSSLVRDSSSDDPLGYDCIMQNIEIEEIVTHEQITCYNTTEKTCSMVI